MHTNKETRQSRFQEKSKAILHCQEPACKLIIVLPKKIKIKKCSNQEDDIRELMPRAGVSQIFAVVPSKASIKMF